MFLFELLIYVFFALIMMILAKKSEEAFGEDTRMDRYLWCYVLFFSFISAIRWRVGMDSEMYIYTFKTGLVRNESTEYLWDWLVLFVKNNGIHFAFGMGVAAFLQIILLARALKEYKYLVIWLPVVIFGGRYFLDLMNGVRQMIVACGFVYLSNYILQKKLVHYLVGVLVLSLIHHSALILLPLYVFAYIPIGKLNLPNKRNICLIILGVCVAIGVVGSFTGATKYVEGFTLLIGYDNYSDWATDIMSGDKAERVGFGPMMLSYLAVAVFIIWYAPRLSDEYGDEMPQFNLWYFFSFVFACFFFLVYNISHLAIRFAQYFEFFQTIMLALLLHYFYVYRTEFRNILYILIISIWLSTLVGVYKSQSEKLEYTTYKTIFTGSTPNYSLNL